MEEIPQSQIAIVIQAAGDNGSIGQNADLIPQTIAEYPAAALRCFQIRPVELISIFQENLIPDPDPPALFLPRLRESSLQGFQDICIALLCTALIPQTVDHQFIPLGCLTKGKAAIQIVLEGDSQIVCFKSVEGNIDFMQPRSIQQDLLPGLEQRSVGGENHPKTGLSCQSQKFCKLGMAQGLSHQMEV